MEQNRDYYEDNLDYLAENHFNVSKYCVYSSFIFLTNVLAGIYFKQYLYAFLFLLLTISSVIHHSSKTKLTNMLDKIALYSIIFYGGYKFYESIRSKNVTNAFDLKITIKYILIIITFLSVVFLYTYGYLTSKYVFHPEYKISQLYHVLMHLISSFGHHIIIAL
jgi:hypothetical protein